MKTCFEEGVETTKSFAPSFYVFGKSAQKSIAIFVNENE